MTETKLKSTWQQKLKIEFIEYWINVAYMATFFSVFILYRRLILSHYDIVLNDYFMGVIKALVFAKVIMIGSFLRIDRKFDHKPLIFPIIYKALLFTLWVVVFDIAEEFIRNLIGSKSFSSAVALLPEHFTNIWIGGVLVVFVSFLPFFTVKELARIIGPEKVKTLFFAKKDQLLR